MEVIDSVVLSQDIQRITMMAEKKVYLPNPIRSLPTIPVILMPLYMTGINILKELFSFIWGMEQHC